MPEGGFSRWEAKERDARVLQPSCHKNSSPFFRENFVKPFFVIIKVLLLFSKLCVWICVSGLFRVCKDPKVQGVSIWINLLWKSPLYSNPILLLGWILHPWASPPKRHRLQTAIQIFLLYMITISNQFVSRTLWTDYRKVSILFCLIKKSSIFMCTIYLQIFEYECYSLGIEYVYIPMIV